MTFLQLRNNLVKLLYEYMNIPVLLNDQLQPIPTYPFMYYQAVQPYTSGSFNIQKTRIRDSSDLSVEREEYTEATISFSVCSIDRDCIRGEDEALELAHKAQGYFLHVGREPLRSLGVTVLGVENMQNRTLVDTSETDRRYGFDVHFGYVRTDTLSVGTIRPPVSVINEEE